MKYVLSIAFLVILAGTASAQCPNCRNGSCPVPAKPVKVQPVKLEAAACDCGTAYCSCGSGKVCIACQKADCPACRSKAVAVVKPTGKPVKSGKSPWFPGKNLPRNKRSCQSCN